MSTPAIRIAHLNQGYGASTVIHDLNLEIPEGEIFGFIGPNGAGKTTTIRTLATLMPPREGTVEVFGIDVDLEPERVRRCIGYMSDHAGVYDRLTVLEYLEFFAEANRVDNARAVTTAVLELVGLESMTDKLLSTLSKGLRQRLQFARVLLHDPKLLILDEPASDLDPRARIEIRDLLLELRDLGKTIFLSSHILSELSDVCTSVGIIDGGRLVASGPIGTLSNDVRLGPLPPVGQSDQTPSGVTGSELPRPPAKIPAVSEALSPLTPTTAPGCIELTPAGVSVPSRAQRRLKLRVLGGTDELKRLLAACPPIRHVESDDGSQVVVRYVGDEQFIAELVRYLVSHGVSIVAIEPERNRLEQVFLEVTKGTVS